MTEQVSDRELLQELAAKPIGSREYQTDNNPNAIKPEYWPDAVEAAKRAQKVWLPAGKASAAAANRKAALAARVAQTDLEDAVEAAGEARGGGHKFA